MSAEFKVFRLNDCDWWMATTLEEAIQAAMKETGLPRDEAADSNAGEVLYSQLERLVFRDDDGTRRSFKDELARRAGEDPRVQMFASTEC